MEAKLPFRMSSDNKLFYFKRHCLFSIFIIKDYYKLTYYYNDIVPIEWVNACAARSEGLRSLGLRWLKQRTDSSGFSKLFLPRVHHGTAHCFQPGILHTCSHISKYTRLEEIFRVHSNMELIIKQSI